MDETKLNELLKGALDGLTEEQKEKAKDCKTLPELVELLGKLGVELPDGLMDAAAGGGPSGRVDRTPQDVCGETKMSFHFL